MASLEMPLEATRVRWLRTTAKILVSTFLGLALGFLLAALIATQFLGYSVLTLQSDSMTPTLQRGDVLVVRPIPINDVKPGDIVVYETGGDRIKIAHRVTGVIVLITNTSDSAESTTSTAYRLQTQGDSTSHPDWNLVDASSLVGRLWFAIPGIGIGIAGLSLQAALFVVAGLTLVAWISWELRALVVGSKKRGNPLRFP